MMKKKFFFLVLFLSLFILSFQAVALTEESTSQALRGLSLIDYIAGDYQAAVSPRGGEIIHDGEFAEMKDFSRLIGHYLQSLQISNEDPLYNLWFEFNLAIQQKKPVVAIEQMSGQLRNEWTTRFSIKTTPSVIPDIKRGGAIFIEHCSTCHGMTGLSDTPLAETLNPKPTRLADPQILDRLSLFQVYNTLNFGVQNTAMPSFKNLSEEERWDVASYVFTLWNNLPPSSDLSSSGIIFSITQIEQSVAAANKGELDNALDLAVDAYLDGFEKSEVLLKTIGQSDRVAAIEKNFEEFREKISRGNKQEIKEKGDFLIQSLKEAQALVSQDNSLSPSVTFLASFTIIFREGLEALLLLVLIFSVLRNLNHPFSGRWIHSSWLLALVAGGLTWVFAREIISGAIREGVEGWIGLIAAAVLVYVSFWLHARKNVELWKQYLIGRIQGRRAAGIYTIVSVSFLAVYREVFETILFVETLRLQAIGQTTPLLMGIAVGFGFLALSAWVLFIVGKKIPLGPFFGFSSIFLYLMAVVFVGQSIHNLQEANFVPLTSIVFVTIPTLGVFPSLEVLLAQGGLIVLFLLTLVWQQWVKQPREELALEEKMAKAALKLFDIHELEEHLMEHLNQLKNKLGKGAIDGEEMKEIIGHMEDLDCGIHAVIEHLSRLQSEIPRRFDEIFEEMKELKTGGEHQKLVEKAEAFKQHLQGIKSRGRNGH